MSAPTPPEPPAVPQYMTYLPGRRPSFKTHTNIGHVKNAIRSGRTPYGSREQHTLYAYELKDGKYEVMWEVDGNATLEELPWKTLIRPPYVKPHVPCNCHNCTS